MAKFAAIAPLLGMVSAGLGIASTIKGMTAKKEKPPAIQKLPDAPKPEDAAAKAADEAKKRARRSSVTDMTRGSALVPEVNVGQKSLLGA